MGGSAKKWFFLSKTHSFYRKNNTELTINPLAGYVWIELSIWAVLIYYDHFDHTRCFRLIFVTNHILTYSYLFVSVQNSQEDSGWLLEGYGGVIFCFPSVKKNRIDNNASFPFFFRQCGNRHNNNQLDVFHSFCFVVVLEDSMGWSKQEQQQNHKFASFSSLAFKKVVVAWCWQQHKQEHLAFFSSHW